MLNEPVIEITCYL